MIEFEDMLMIRLYQKEQEFWRLVRGDSNERMGRTHRKFVRTQAQN